MMSTNNILSPANGEPIIVPSQDVVLGLYYMTRERINARGEGMMFSNVQEVHRAYENRLVDLHARVRVRIEDSEMEEGQLTRRTRIIETTVGRSLLSEILPEGLPFEMVNRNMDKKAISGCINACYRQVGLKKTVVFADQLMYTGFYYATRAGISIGVNDMYVPEEKSSILKAADKEVKEIQDQYASGLVTNGERYNRVVDIWSRTNDIVAKAMMEKLGKEETINFRPAGLCRADPPARRHARPDGKAGRLDHRDADYGELPRGPRRPAVLHLDTRRPQGPRRYGTEDRQLGLSDTAPG
jgi:DNA-directed RNA polymerase subunit beta'